MWCDLAGGFERKQAYQPAQAFPCLHALFSCNERRWVVVLVRWERPARGPSVLVLGFQHALRACALRICGIVDLIEDLSPPSVSLLDRASLFLDLDGTLLDLVDRPDQVVADAALRALLIRLNGRLGGRLAIVSGRSIAQMEGILGDAAGLLRLAGSHGIELRAGNANVRPPRPATLDLAEKRLRRFAAMHPPLLVEGKSYGVALHYRMVPAMEEAALACAADVAASLGLVVQPGNMMVELRPIGADKGDAVRLLMQAAPMAGGKPVFIGDDLTDEAGFGAAMALNGDGILVGGPRPSAARFRLADPAAVRQWLAWAVQ